jgi:6-phosphogluconolactonase (cycloisomerase 2 family)
LQLKVRQAPPLSFFNLLLLCCSVFLAGCAAGGSSPELNPPSSGTPPVLNPPPVSNPPASGPPSGSEFLYFTNSGLTGVHAGNSVSVSSLNPTTGALSNFQNAVNAPTIEFGPLNMASDQSIFSSAGGKYIYAGGTSLIDINEVIFPSEGASNYGIYGFSIPGTQGQLAPITSVGMFNPKTPFGQFTGLTMDGLGRYLYTSDSDGYTQRIREFTVGTGGAFEEGPILTTSSVGWALQTADPTGKYIYAWSNDYNSGNIGLSVFSVNSSTGALTEVAGSPFLVATASSTSLVIPSAQFMGGSITFHPSSKFLYASFLNYRLPENAPTYVVDDYIYTFSIDPVTGALSAAPGPPIFLPNVSLNQIVMHPNGKFLYASSHLTNVSSPGILMFPIDGTSGAATATAPISVGTGNTYYSQILIDPSGSVLVGIGATIDSFTINSSTGLLTAASSLTTDSGTTPGPLAFGSSAIVRIP